MSRTLCISYPVKFPNSKRFGSRIERLVVFNGFLGYSMRILTSQFDERGLCAGPTCLMTNAVRLLFAELGRECSGILCLA